MNSKRNNNAMVQQGNNFLIIALQLFLGEPVAVAEKHDDDDVVSFMTERGSMGSMEPNAFGNWDIWIGEEIVYEVEFELGMVILGQKDENLIDLYDSMKEIDQDTLKYKSKRAYEVIQTAVENVILNYSLPLVGQVQIREQEVIYKNSKKVKINLN